jgi:hypothetical protein
MAGSATDCNRITVECNRCTGSLKIVTTGNSPRKAQEEDEYNLLSSAPAWCTNIGCYSAVYQ